MQKDKTFLPHIKGFNIPTYRVITLFLGVIDESGLDSEKGELQNSERGEG